MKKKWYEVLDRYVGDARSYGGQTRSWNTLPDNEWRSGFIAGYDIALQDVQHVYIPRTRKYTGETDGDDS